MDERMNCYKGTCKQLKQTQVLLNSNKLPMTSKKNFLKIQQIEQQNRLM